MHNNEIKPKEVPFPMVFSMVTLGLLCLLLSLMVLPQVRDLILKPATDILMNSQMYISPILGM
jgi:formate hydrogenlyase subunit 3/multisubunit Na+/H+ antiporter MnhD subunit